MASMYDIPELDTRTLANLGNTFLAARKVGEDRDMKQRSLAALAQIQPDAQGNIDYRKAAAAAFQAGDAETGMGLARLLEAQAQKDYARQIDNRNFEYQKGQDQFGNALKLQSLNLSQAKTPEQEAQGRKRAAEGLGLAPNSPAYNSYVLTGKMPREDQAPLTATDKKAILEADENVFRIEGVISNLNSAKELNDKAYSGFGAETRGYLSSLLGSQEGEATQQYQNLVGEQALSNLKSIFGGNPTEGERKILLDLQASVNKSPEVRRSILEVATKMAEKRLQFSKQQAEQLRGGTYYGQNGKRATPQQPAQQNLEGRTATGANGQKLIFKGGKWLDAGQGL